MKILRKLLKGFLLLLLIPIVYIAIAFLLTAIPVNSEQAHGEDAPTIYLNTNGVHLDIIIPVELLTEKLRQDLVFQPSESYLSFGWGDENFYLNTPTWGDLTLKNAVTALLLNSSTLMHVTRYSRIQTAWVAVPVSESALGNLNAYIADSFQTDEAGNKLLLSGQGYETWDDFYRARGSYSSLNTCNSWANAALAESGLPACYWTPFDFGVLNKYNNP